MRIVSAHPAATELLFALGAGALIVARCDACTYPESAQKIPSIGESAQLTADMVSILEPDLIVLGPGQEALAERLSGMRTHTLRYITLEECLNAIKHLASVIERDVEGDILVHDLRTLIEKVRLKANKYKRTRVYAETKHSPPSTNAMITELLSIAGAQNFSGDVTCEQLQEFDPFLIIVSVPGEGVQFDVELLRSRSGWESLSAVRNDRIYVIDDALLHRPGPRLADGIKLLAKILHGMHINGS